jgi:F-type H+-transporting ATPase subunit gamma
MAVGKEIRTKIKSIQSTQKITRAMEMVAASKMKRVQQRMDAARPYAIHIHQVIEHVAKSHSEHNSIFLQERPIKKAGIIVVSTDRGLCGGLNINLFRQVINKMQALEESGAEIQMCLLGSRAESYFRQLGANTVAAASQLGETPRTEAIVGPVKAMLDAYANDEIQALYLAHNLFENTMSQKPNVTTLFPLSQVENFEPKEAHTNHWDYIYEPNNEALLDLLIQRYVEQQVYRGVVENIACEQAARMVAMKSASDNAGDLIHSLQLAYNKARQAAITQELSEIVSGAAAV